MAESRKTGLHRVELRLEQSLGAKGKTWQEKVGSVEKTLPLALIHQLQQLPNLEGQAFESTLSSVDKQLKLFARASNAQTEAIWTEEQRTEARAKLDVNVNRIGQVAKTTLVSRLTWWLFETRRAIPQRAYSLSRTWRVPMTLVFAISGAAIGWFTFGLGAATMGGLTLGILGFILWSENNLARGMWVQTRAVELALAAFKGFILIATIVLFLVLVSAMAWLIAQYWNVR
jgi:hypothetical protein